MIPALTQNRGTPGKAALHLKEQTQSQLRLEKVKKHDTIKPQVLILSYAYLSLEGYLGRILSLLAEEGVKGYLQFFCLFDICAMCIYYLLNKVFMSPNY